VDEKILQKPGPLTPEEYEVIKQHPVIGERIVGSLAFLTDVRSIIRAHHESVDGSGYPDGLEGDQIPRSARILRVADAYDAMTSERPYRKAMTMQQAMAEIKRYANVHFAAEVVTALDEMIQDGGSVKGKKPRAPALLRLARAGETFNADSSETGPAVSG
jgi:HD-GYP domain-containing protein (c-di-GMP phosphodiesterase class II)